jgi:hypothetical protein
MAGHGGPAPPEQTKELWMRRSQSGAGAGAVQLSFSLFVIVVIIVIVIGIGMQPSSITRKGDTLA